MKRIAVIILFLITASAVYAGSGDFLKNNNSCIRQIRQEAQREKKQELAAVRQQYRAEFKIAKSKKEKRFLKKTLKKEEKKILAAYKKRLKESQSACAEQESPAPDMIPQDLSSLPCGGKPPVFTAGVTDFSKVLFLIPPVTIQGNYLKGHGYLKISERVPVYAPVDSVAFDGSFYSEDNRGQYSLTFDVTCDVRYMMDHLSEVIPSLAEQFGATPASDSRTKGLTPISFKAGDLIGYTIGTDLGKTWDFGVYNFTQQNPYNNPAYPDFESYKNKNAVCPYAYYDSEKRTFYKNLMRNADGGPLTNQTNLCAD